MITNIQYFDDPGPQNTQATLQAAHDRAEQLGIKHIVVASDTGKTARLVLDTFPTPYQVSIVTNPRGITLPVSALHDYLPHFKEYKEQYIQRGIQQVSCSFSDTVAIDFIRAGARVGRLDWAKLHAYAKMNFAAVECVGIGFRVALTCTIWAYLEGGVPANVEAIGIGGTGFGGGGADTALVIHTGETWREWRVLETLVRPRVSPPSEQPG